MNQNDTKSSLSRWLAVLLLTALSGLAVPPTLAGVRAKAGPYRVEIASEPAVIPVGKAKLILTITDSAGKPVPDAQVRAIAQMPGMPMGEQEQAAIPQPGQPGNYAVPAQFAMAGDYVARFKITSSLGSATAMAPLHTGQSLPARRARPGAPGKGTSEEAPAEEAPALAPLLFRLIGALAVGFVLYRVWRGGQRFNPRAILNRQVLGGLLLLAVMLAASVYAVRNFRRVGAMTPLEAQGMEMATPAPPGAAAVELATVQRGTVESTVRYTGSAVAYGEQDVSPRVTGWITWMPFYVGDRVKRGQLLARLDTSQVAPQIAERRAAQRMAEQGVAVARTEYEQAQAAVNLARAEAAGKRGAVAEARSNLTAAREERAGAAEDLAAAETGVTDAAAQLQAARADQDYWTWQIRRTGDLHKEGAVSGEEFQKERAQAENAAAKLRQAQTRVDQVQAQVRATRARLRKAEAMVAAAGTQVQQTAAELAAHHAHVESAQAAADTARKRIEQAQAGVQQARAALAAATTTRGYTEIRSLVDGVVTQRLISPGVLVNPGQAILKVTQVRPIRLQANVAETDLPRIPIGARIRVQNPSNAAASLITRVTSVTPAVDPAARTGIVEAVYPNREGRFLPGQFVVMQIPTGRSAGVLRIPSRALQWRAAPSGDVLSTRSRPFVWVAEAMPAAAASTGEEQRFTVHPVEVQLGVSDGENTAVIAGLKEGQRIVAAGQQYLKDGDSVMPVGAGPAHNQIPAPRSSKGERGQGGGMPGMPGM